MYVAQLQRLTETHKNTILEAQLKMPATNNEQDMKPLNNYQGC